MATNAAYVAWYVSTFDYAHATPARIEDSRYWRSWQLGVNVPIPNPHFTWEKKVTMIGTNTQNSGASHIILNLGSTELRDRFKNLLTVQGYGVISNNATKIGEIVRINTWSNENSTTARIVFDRALEHTYTAPNYTIEFFSDRIASGWDVNDSLLVPRGLAKSYPVDLEDVDGKLQGQQLYIGSGNFTGTQKEFTTNIPNIQEYAKQGNGLYYRVGARYHIKYYPLPASIGSADAGYISVKILGCDTPEKIILNYITGAEDNKYFIFHSYPAFSDWKTYNTLLDSTTYNRLYIAFVGGTAPLSNLEINFGIDDIYLEHSAGFETTQDKLGTLLMTYAPNRESLSMNADSLEEVVQVSNADKYPFFPLGNPNKSKKYSIGCTFEDSNMDTYRKLQILQTWQDNGFNLNLHTHMPELPEVLTGRMKLGNLRKNVWAFTRVSFDFEFTEV